FMCWICAFRVSVFDIKLKKPKAVISQAPLKMDSTCRTHCRPSCYGSQEAIELTWLPDEEWLRGIRYQRIKRIQPDPILEFGFSDLVQPLISGRTKMDFIR